MKKKQITALLLSGVLAAGAVLAGCGTGGSPAKKETEEDGTKKSTEAQTDKESEKDAEEGGEDKDTETTAALDYDGVTLSVVLAQGWDTPGREALFQKYTDKTGVKFDIQMLPDDTAAELVKTKFATKELPDIIFNSGSVREHTYMLPEENLLDLTEEPWADQLVNEEAMMVNGKIWGLPMGGQGYFCFAVNKKVFKDNKLEIPASKEELEKCFETLKDNGIQPMYLGSKDPWLVGNMTSGGIQKALDADPELINKLDRNEITYSEIPGMTSVLEDLRRWNEKGWLGAKTMADSWDGEFKAFGENLCGVTIGLTTWDKTMEEKYPGSSENMIFIPYYIGDADTYFAGTTAQWYIPKDGKHTDIVKDFFRFCTEQENLNEFYKAMGEASTPWKDVEVECLTPTKQLIEDLNAGKYSFHYGHNSLVQGQDFDGLCKLAQEVLIGNKTAEEAVKEYDTMRAQICKALGMEGF